ncbi:MAG: 6-hydroxymethylpterin diphosphokinase MptE-like protein, partial [Halobacteriota archaeon]
MEYADWEPFYEAILIDMDYSRDADREAAALLADAAGRDSPPARLADAAGAEVAVVGDSPSMQPRRARSYEVVFAADGAARRLLEAEVEVDVVVTDLDGAPETAVELSREGAVVAVHAHGDNVRLLERWLPEFEGDLLLPTAQCRPPPGVYNHGGFTDGDRAAYLADACGARSIELVGFDVAAAEGVKRRKLRW